jgi:hypothetical protein
MTNQSSLLNKRGNISENSINSPPETKQYQHPAQFEFHFDPRIVSSLVLFPTLFFLGLAIAITVEIDRDYNGLSNFVPIEWIIGAPIIIAQVMHGLYVAVQYPKLSRTITKYWVDKMIPVPWEIKWQQMAKIVIYFLSTIEQGVLVAFSGAMSLGHFLGMTIYIDPTTDSSWTLFWLYFICTISFALSATFTGFTGVDEFRSYQQFERYWTKDDDLKTIQPHPDYVPPQF